MIQWLGLGAFTAEGPGSIPGQGTKIPQATWRGQKKKRQTLLGHTTEKSRDTFSLSQLDPGT